MLRIPAFPDTMPQPSVSVPDVACQGSDLIFKVLHVQAEFRREVEACVYSDSVTCIWIPLGHFRPLKMRPLRHLEISGIDTPWCSLTCSHITVTPLRTAENGHSLDIDTQSVRKVTVHWGYDTRILLSVSKWPLKCAIVSVYSVVKQRLKCNTGKVCNCLIQLLLTMVRGHHRQQLS
jgi:hypothetical protein